MKIPANTILYGIIHTVCHQAHLLRVFLGEAVHNASLRLPLAHDLAYLLHHALVLLLHAVGDVGSIEGVCVAVWVVEAQNANT